MQLAAAAAAAGAGVLYGLLFPPFEAAALSWLALVPLVWALSQARSLAGAAALAGLFAFVGTAAVVPWLVATVHGHFERSLAVGLGFWLWISATALAPYYAVLLGAQAWAARRLPRALAPFLFAAAWVAAEWSRTHLGLRSPWTRLGDAQVDAVYLRQLADLFGVYGIGFVVALGNAVAFELLRAVAARRRGAASAGLRATAVGVGAFGALLALSLGYGALRLPALPDGDSDFEIAVVQGNLDPQHRWQSSRAGHVLRRYGGLTRDLLRRRDGTPAPDLVVWPENAIQTPVDDPVYGPPLRVFAARAPLLVGAPRSEAARSGQRAFNSAFLIDADGVRDHYDKRRLLPFNETRPFRGLASFGERGDLDFAEYAAGTRGALFRVGEERLAPLICMEALYPALAREAVNAGASALVVLSNDGWFAGRGGAAQHLAMARFRAIETRRPLVRSTTTGISAVISPDGRVAAVLGEGERGVLRARLPRAPSSRTVYARIGDAFAIGCVWALGAAVAAATLRRRRRVPH